MTTSKITTGQKVKSAKLGLGEITKVITKSTGYVEVTYANGQIKKEMAFNLTDEQGISLKAKPVVKPLTPEQQAKLDRSHARFMYNMDQAVLNENFLPCQVAAKSYNRNLIR